MKPKTYTGVQFNTLTQLWQARVTSKGTVYECGHHETPRLAAIARDTKILEKNLPQKLQVLKPKKDGM